MSLTSKRWSEVTRTSLVDAVSDWLAEAYPYDTRPTTTAVRVREGAHDPVFRVEINESDKRNRHQSDSHHRCNPRYESLSSRYGYCFDQPDNPCFRRRITTPNKQPTELCLKIATELKIRDAEQPIDGGIQCRKLSKVNHLLLSLRHLDAVFPSLPNIPGSDTNCTCHRITRCNPPGTPCISHHREAVAAHEFRRSDYQPKCHHHYLACSPADADI